MLLSSPPSCCIYTPSVSETVFSTIIYILVIIMCTLGTLTPSNVMKVMKEVTLQSLANWLYIPRSKEKEIRQRFPDEVEQKKQLIYYWFNTDPLANWRRLIRVLDKIRQSHLADPIRPNAEPLTGSHHTILHHWY